MTRIMLRAVACVAFAVALQSIISVNQNGTSASAAENEVKAAPPTDINDAPALPPPGATNRGSQTGPVLNRPDRSLLRTVPEEATPEPAVAPQTTTGTEPTRPEPQANISLDNAATQQPDEQGALEGGILFGRMTEQGLPIERVEKGSVFYRSGLREGDVIVSLRGRPIRSEADFAQLGVLSPGQRVPVVVLREGGPGTIALNYAPEADGRERKGHQRPTENNVYLGVIFDPQHRDFVVVQRVNPGSPAQRAGLQANDIILALNGQDVRAISDAVNMIRGMQPGEELRIMIERSRSQRQLVARLDAATRAHTTARPIDMDREFRAFGERGDEREPNRANGDERRLDRGFENSGYNQNRENNGGRGFRLFPRFRN